MKLLGLRKVLPWCRTKGEEGFTLIETLVALAILSLAVPALFAVFFGALDRTRDDRLEMQARVLAQSLLAQAEATSVANAHGTADGMVWELRTTRSDSSGNLQSAPEPENVSAIVRWRSGTTEKFLRLSTYVLAPREVAR